MYLNCLSLLGLGVVAGIGVATNAPRQSHVLRLDGDALGVYRAQVCVLEETDQEGLGCLLQSHEGCRLEAKVHPASVHSDLLDETLEGHLANEELGGFLEATDLQERPGARPEAMGTLGDGHRGAHSLATRSRPFRCWEPEFRVVLGRQNRAIVGKHLTRGLLGASHDCCLDLQLWNKGVFYRIVRQSLCESLPSIFRRAFSGTT